MDVDKRFGEAQARGAVIAIDVLNNTIGPSMALLIIFAAYTEALRALEAKIPAASMPKFVSDQAKIEARYKRQVRPLLISSRTNAS